MAPFRWTRPESARGQRVGVAGRAREVPRKRKVVVLSKGVKETTTRMREKERKRTRELDWKERRGEDSRVYLPSPRRLDGSRADSRSVGAFAHPIGYVVPLAR